MFKPREVFRLLRLMGMAFMLMVPMGAYSQTPQVYDLGLILIPRDLGAISNRYVLPQPSKTVVLIQDMHTNQTAQRNASGILEYLARDHGMQLILVEGDSGDIGVDGLAWQSTRLTRKALADSFVADGFFGGHEHLDLSSDLPIELWGVEDPNLYARNLEHLIRAEALQESIQKELRFVRWKIDSLKETVLDEPLQHVYAVKEHFDDELLSLKQSLLELVWVAEENHFGVQDYSEIKKYIQVQELVEQMDLDLAQTQRKAVLNYLEKNAQPKDLQSIKLALRSYKNKTISRVQFYQVLEDFAGRYNTGAPPHDAFSTYALFLKLNEEIQPRLLIGEFEQFTEDLARFMAKTQNERHWVKYHTQMQRLDRLSRLKWSYRDYQHYKKDIGLLDIRMSMLWVHDFLMPEEQFELSLITAPLLKNQLRRMAEFYDQAYARDVAMVQRSLRKMDDDSHQFAAMILGGFHTDHVTQLLVSQGVQVLVVTPYVEDLVNAERYPLIAQSKKNTASR